MQFTVNRDLMNQAVSAVQRATASRVIQPILANICFKADAATQTLTMLATDLDLFIETTIEAEIQAAGQTTLSAKKLGDIMAKLPSGEPVLFTIHQDVQTAHIQCGQSQFDIRTLPAEEYPMMPQAVETTAFVEVGQKAFLKAIQQTVFAAASYETNNILGGVFFRLATDALEMVATDGSRLARRLEVMERSTVQEPVSAIIPARTLQEVVKLMGSHGGEDATVKVALHDAQIFITSEKYRLLSRLLDGQYPKYQQLIPAQNSIVARANRQAFMSSLERTAIMANERTNIVKMMLEHNQLSLTANTPDLGDSKDVMPIQYEGEPFNIAFNYRYVLDALRVIESDDVRMETNGALAPTIFKSSENDDYMCLVMPVQVK